MFDKAAWRYLKQPTQQNLFWDGASGSYFPCTITSSHESTWCCKDTVYGRRDGVITGLAVINRDRANLFKSSPGFKSGVIHDIHMCPRNAMWKPEALYGLLMSRHGVVQSKDLQIVNRNDTVYYIMFAVNPTLLCR